MTILEGARATLALNLWPVPIKPGTKRPPMREWQKLRLTVDDLQEHFSNGLGVLRGVPPRPIADVDVDCPEALAVAPLFDGPKTGRISGRASKPRSHYFFELPEEFSSEQFNDPLRTGKNGKPSIIELRGRGGQTVVPPTIHESGEQIRWEHKGEFGKTTFAELLKWVRKIAAAALLVRYWPRGHETRHALAGMPARAGWPENDADGVLRSWCRLGPAEKEVERPAPPIAQPAQPEQIPLTDSREWYGKQRPTGLPLWDAVRP
jgi:hypothetical protein